ncbi:Spermatogenesis-associated protein 20 [Orchesella cincta]|uniref:Spermatogenesis-associated protein 20 n=1 Tax=Orchesella cincta TaxID=48709 RepID=A0A1D2MLR4_ORCCI|nr:Spermatogenesis-associated protein 20 [Orchesella cincta]
MATSSKALQGIVNDLQHQKHAWCKETHELAVQRSLPIFLSVGYSTCHWCHVMERESFENPQIAAIMNSHFINVKIDREEHPDIDRIYMSFVQAISGSGGWPMSVWMTPSLKPFYGGTYYPPENRYFGRPGFKSLLLSLAEQWDENQAKCDESGENIVKLLEKSALLPVSENLPDGEKIMEKCAAQLKRSYEPSFAGFSESPKFPQPGNLVFLIDYCGKHEGNDAVEKMVTRTLSKMAEGGIHDHVGKGFARYSTDKKWHVPHFEKMLYDNAQLLEAYVSGFKLSGDSQFADIARDIIEYVNRDLSHVEGGFFSAEDADSENKEGLKREGAFYVWKTEEIDTILVGESDGVNVAEVFKFAFGVKEKGNVDPYQDPHDELKEQNVLFEAANAVKCAEKFGVGEEVIKKVLEEAKNKLFAWRNANRKRPGLDDKIIASWNGLMITGLCTASLGLSDLACAERAEKAMRFCLKYLLTENDDLYRTCYADGESITNLETPILACVDDFANLISGCLGLFQASGGDLEWIRVAERLQKKQDELFWDEERGGYFNGRKKDDVIVRMKDDDDGAEPSSNSTSLRNLMQLYQVAKVLKSGEPETYEQKIPTLIKQFTDRMEKIPISLPIMTSLVNSYVQDLTTTVVFENSPEQLSVIGRKILPNGSMLVPVRNTEDFKPESVAAGKIVKFTGRKFVKKVVNTV